MPTAMGTTSPASTPSASKPSNDLTDYEHNARDLLCQFLNTHQPDACPEDKTVARTRPRRLLKPATDSSTAPCSRTTTMPASKRRRQRNQVLDEHLGAYHPQFLIATIPDPVTSHLQYDTDLEMEGLQRSISEVGYVLDRFYLPWSSAGKEPADNDKAAKPSVDRTPGLLLFRHSTDLLLVFLVGETPTSGVHKLALRSALLQIKDLSAKKKDLSPTAPTHEPILVMGPYFTGSAPSLQATLKEWNKEEGAAWTFQIMSGTATGVEQKTFSGLPSNSDASAFHATAHTVAATICGLVGYLQHLKPGSRLAVLDEVGTEFGRAGSVSSCGNGEVKLLELHFPLHVSEIRREIPSSGNSASPLNPNAGRSDFSVVTPQTSAQDLIPSFSGALQKSSTDQSLSDLLSTVAREHVQYLAIVATDIEDTIFLAQQTRSRLPSITLFVIGSDLLFLSDKASSGLRGMLVISTYPLFNANQLWTFPFEGSAQPEQFRSDRTEGIYNATLALLGEPAKMLEYSAPFVHAPREPSLWLVAVGRDAFWPVDLLGSYLQEDTRASDNSYLWALKRKTKELPQMQLGFMSPFAIFLFWAATFGAIYFVGWDLPGLRPLSDSQGGTAFVQERARRVASFSFSLALVAVYLLALFLPLTPILAHIRVSAFAVSAEMIWTSILGAVVCVALLCKTAKLRPGLSAVIDSSWRRRPFSAPTFVGVPALVVLLLVAYGVTFVAPWDHGTVSAAVFAAFRFSNLGSGLSPFVPLFAVGLAGLSCCYCTLRRLELLESMRVESKRGDERRFLGFELGGLSDLKTTKRSSR